MKKNKFGHTGYKNELRVFCLEKLEEDGFARKGKK